MIKTANVLQRPDGYYCTPYNQSVTGGWILSSPTIKLPLDAPADVLGQVILMVLEKSTGPVPHPAQSEWVAVLEPLLSMARVKSWRALAKDARSVSVEAEDDLYHVFPKRYEESSGNFLRLSENTIELPISASPEELGHAIQSGAARCE